MPPRIDGLRLRTLVEERKKREVDPTLSVLRELMMQTPAGGEEKHAQKRMGELLALIEMLVRWYDDVKRMDNQRLMKLLALGARVQKVLEFKDRITGRRRPPPEIAANEG